MSTLDEIEQEKQRISERLARLDAERGRLAEQLNELEVAARVLSRFGKAEAVPRRRGRPARAATKAPGKAPAAAPSPRRRARVQAGGLSVSDAALQVVREHPEGVAASDVLNTLSSQYGLKVRPNHLGIALQRHRRAGRLDQRDERWYPPPHSNGQSGAAA
jgi:hypothetical protein